MVHARQSQPHPHEKSRELQRRLYLAAKRNRSRRFHALYDRIVRPDVLWRAWEEVRANQGRAGVDGVRIEDVERSGVEAYLAGLAVDLKAEVYRPQPVLRVETEAGWSHAATGHPDRARSGGPAGVQDRHRADL
jgi:RNA-directed DNA polymerase